MTTTTEYGTWCNIVDQYSVGVETTVMDGYFGSEGAEGFDFEAIVDDYRDAINEALPDGVFLTGNEFIGPAYDADCHWDGDLDIKAIVDGIELGPIVERHQTAA